LDFAIHRHWRRDQRDSIALEFDAARQVLVYGVLNRGNFDVMSDLVVAERVSASAGKKGVERLRLFFLRRARATAERERLAAAVADQGGRN
jgi:hypothetical protein